MPRTADRKPNYIASMNCWRKRYKSKAKTWTAGAGKSDTVAKSRAFAGCIAWMGNLDQQAADDQNTALYGMTEEQGEAAYAKIQKKIKSGQAFGSNPNHVVRIKELEEQLAAGASGKTPKAIADLIKAWLDVQLQRVERGEKFPNAPRSARLARSTMGNYVMQSRYIEAYANEDKLPIDASGVKAWLMGWRTHEESQLLAGDIKPSTFNSRMSCMRAILSWLEDSEYFESLPTPRIIARCCEKYKVEPNAKSIPLEDIRILWENSDSRNRLYIALGLNAALYSSEIAALTDVHLTEDGRLAGLRPKTKVPFSTKLWKVTRELIAENREQGGGLLFLTRKGTPVYVERSTLEKGYTRNDSVGLRFGRLAKKCGVKASFGMLRDTSATMLEKYARQYSDFHLAHRDTRMAAFYIDQSAADLTEYDAALDSMEAELALGV